MQRVLLGVYRDDGAAAQVCERLVDLDEGFRSGATATSRWSSGRSASKRGTGGSSGAAYLRTTLHKPLFPDLWAVRSEL